MASDIELAARAWLPVELGPAAAVTSARLQLHHAAQVASAPAVSYLPPAADDGHTNFGWVPDLRAFLSRRVTLPHPRRFGWRPEDLSLLSVDDDGTIVASFALLGRTMAEAHAWARAECEGAGGDGARYTEHKHYDIPPHPVGRGAEFDADPSALRALALLWANAAPLLDAVAGADGDVRLWPHHFDSGFLIRIDATRSIGGGFTPGDHYYDEPYWYLCPYPKPATARRPPLDGGGVWRDGEFMGAVLPWSAHGASASQGGSAAAYLESALNGCRELLDR